MDNQNPPSPEPVGDAALLKTLLGVSQRLQAFQSSIQALSQNAPGGELARHGHASALRFAREALDRAYMKRAEEVIAQMLFCPEADRPLWREELKQLLSRLAQDADWLEGQLQAASTPAAQS